MKKSLTIGIVGGTSPESTVSYYRQIIRKHEAEFHDHGYPRIVICSVSFQQYIDWQHNNEWDRVAHGLEGELHSLEAAGADFALLAANTMHKVLPMMKRSIPVLNILDVLGAHTKELGVRRVGLTGTKFTMTGGFYVDGLKQRGLEVILPEQVEQDAIHRIIFDELILGKIVDESVKTFDTIVRALSRHGAESVILGCTELDMLTSGGNQSVKLIDSAKVHADAAWSVAMSGDRNHPLLSKP